MCDEKTWKDDQDYLKKSKISRRNFNRMTAGATVAMMLPPVVNAQQVSSTHVEITTPDGVADCFYVHPASGKHPAVLVWPDIFGLRDAFETMGTRLAQSGYSVLVVNPFYRTQKAPTSEPGADFNDPDTRSKLFALAGSLNETTHYTDARAFLGWLDNQAEVDTSRGAGTTGYCMGGPMVMRTVAAVPARFKAGATFHGGGLATDQPNSPHLTIPQTQASMLHAIAANDDEQSPNVKDILRKAYADAGISAEVEVYTGTLHGWCAIDSQVYNMDMAERAWSRLLALFDTALA